MTSAGYRDDGPRLSIVLPHYQHEDKLAEALAAIDAQTMKPHEVIVVDDGSARDRFRVVETIVRDFPTVRLERHERNQGVNVAAWTGLRSVTGEFVAFAAADDVLSPVIVERAAVALARYPETGIAFSDPAEMDESGKRRRVLPLSLSEGIRHFSPLEFRRTLRRSFFFLNTGNVWFRTAALRDFGPFDNRLRWHADLFAAYGMGLAHGATYVPDAIAYFRVSPASYSARGRRSAEQVAVLEAWMAKTREVSERHVRAAFIEAAVLPDYSLNALRALRSDHEYATAALLRRILVRILWNSVRRLLPWNARRTIRRIVSARA
jgi:glycosyltransferase involved in cell wall biosynthesis